MGKRLTCTASLLLFTACAIAQGPAGNGAEAKRVFGSSRGSAASPMASPFAALKRTIESREGAAAKTTGVGKRLVAWSIYQNNTIQDSLTVQYLAARSSTFSFDWLGYNFDTEYPYTGAGNVFFDTVRVFDPPGSSSFGVAGYRSYNAQSGIVRFDDLSAFPAVNRQDISYNPQGLPASETELQYDINTFSWINVRQMKFAYDGLGNLSSDTTLHWDGTNWVTAYSKGYTYNAGGSPVLESLWDHSGSVPVLSQEVAVLYNAANKPIRFWSRMQGAGPVLENNSKDTFAYMGNAKVYGARFIWDAVNNSWTKYFEEFRHLNANNLPDSIRTMHLLGPAPTPGDVKLAYNSDDLPVYMRNYDANSALDFEERYYYESFDLGVADNAPVKALTVYPNPAGHSLRVQTLQDAKGAVTYSLSDAAGRRIQVVRMQDAASPIINFDVSALAPGQYFLEAKDAAGNRGTARFVKQ